MALMARSRAESGRENTALLQTGTALEDPSVADCWMCSDAGKKPAECIVFLDNMHLKLELGGECHDLLLWDHRAALWSSVADTQTRQAVTRRSAGNEGVQLGIAGGELRLAFLDQRALVRVITF